MTAFLTLVARMLRPKPSDRVSPELDADDEDEEGEEDEEEL